MIISRERYFLFFWRRVDDILCVFHALSLIIISLIFLEDGRNDMKLYSITAVHIIAYNKFQILNLLWNWWAHRFLLRVYISIDLCCLEVYIIKRQKGRVTGVVSDLELTFVLHWPRSGVGTTLRSQRFPNVRTTSQQDPILWHRDISQGTTFIIGILYSNRTSKRSGGWV